MKEIYSTGKIENANYEKKGILYYLNNEFVNEKEILKAAEDAIKILKDNPDFAYVVFFAALDCNVPGEFVVTKYMSLEDFKSMINVCRVIRKNNNEKNKFELFEKLGTGLVKDAVERAELEQSGVEKQ